MVKKISGMRIVDNSRAFKNAAPPAIERALEAIGQEAESNAKRIVTEKDVVDTGLLRNSITHALGGQSAAISSYKADKGDGKGSYIGTTPKKSVPTVYIGTNVKYAPYQEAGARGKSGRPFLAPAIEDFKNDYKQILKEELEKG